MPRGGSLRLWRDDGLHQGGINLFTDPRQPVGTQIKMNCFADNSSSISTWQGGTAYTPPFQPYLGWTYQAGPGNQASPDATINVVKVTDSSGIFGIATCNATTKSGCGTYPN